MQPRIRNHRVHQMAFTLVELLVVIAIMGVLVALLLPAVQSAREAARKLQCVNQIPQLGLAVLNFESTNKALPPAGLVSQGPLRCPGYGNTDSEKACFDFDGKFGGQTYSWLVLILPFFEEQALYDQFEFTRTIYTLPKNPQARFVSGFICPSDGLEAASYDGTGLSITPSQQIRFAKGNYHGYISAVHQNQHGFVPGALGNFKPGSRIGQSLKKVIDGTSRTLAVTEVRTLDRAWDWRGAWALPGPAAAALDWHPENDHIQAPFYRPDPAEWCNAQTPNRPTIIEGGSTCTERQIADQQPSCVQPLYANGLKMPCQTASYFSSAPRSLHPGGVTAVTLDGHAGFVSDNIDSIVFAYLISTNDRQPSDVSQYLP
jgi:prepilin-type N-terminal cleavage/methylation domain-containing protein